MDIIKTCLFFICDMVAVFIICFFIAGGNITPSRKVQENNPGGLADGQGEE